MIVIFIILPKKRKNKVKICEINIYFSLYLADVFLKQQRSITLYARPTETYKIMLE